MNSDGTLADWIMIGVLFLVIIAVVVLLLS